MRKDKELAAIYVGDSKDYHVFLIGGGKGFMGNIYVPKDESAADTLTIRLLGQAKWKAIWPCG